MVEPNVMMTPELQAKLQIEAECFKSLVRFREVHLAGEKDVPSAEFHHRWSDILLNGRDHYAIEGFRESGKDQVVFQSNLMHAMTYPLSYRSYIMMVGANKQDMAFKLKDITRQWQSDEHKDLRSNLVKVIEDSGNAFEALYTHGRRVRIETYGRLGGIRGRVWGIKRPDIVILNDVQDPDDMRSDTIPETDWDWFLSDVMFLGKESRIFIIGNNLGARCIVERAIAHARALRFQTMKIGIADSLEDDGTFIRVGNPTWPARHTKDEILNGYLSFKSIGKADHYMREKMCINVAPLSRPLSSSKLVKVDIHDPAVIKDVQGSRIYTLVDPAIGLKKTNDPTVIATIADATNGRRYVLEIDRRQRKSSEQRDDIFKQVARWRSTAVGIESVAYQKVLCELVEEEQVRRGITFPVVPIFPPARQSKEFKIVSRLQPLLEAGVLCVPEDAAWREVAEQEMDAFPDGEHDDIWDTVSMADDIKVDRLVSTFRSSQCVVESMKIPSNWPRWAGMVVSPNGTALILMLVCSPEGRLYVTDEIYANGSADELFHRYQKVLSNRLCTAMYAPSSMFKPDILTGSVWAGTYMSAGFPLSPGSEEWATLIPILTQQVDAPSSGAQPRLLIFRNCKRLCWELDNAIAGEEKEKKKIDQRMAIQTLLMLLASRPSWRDTTSEDTYGGTLNYPEADIP